MRIDVVVYDGWDELDAFGPYEVFRHAARNGADLDVAYVAVDREAGSTVTASHGTTLTVQRRLDPAEVGEDDVVVVAGGGWRDPGPGSKAEAAKGDLPKALATAHENGALVAGVCTGGMLLAEAGLLHGRRATTHHTALADLPSYGAEVVRERVVDDGEVVTAGGVTSGIDLALHLVERLVGADHAEYAATVMEHDRVRVGTPSRF